MRSKPYIDSATEPAAKVQITFVQNCPENYISLWEINDDVPDMYLVGFLIRNRLVDLSGRWSNPEKIRILKSTIAAWIRGDYHAPLSTVSGPAVEELRTFSLS